MQSRLITRVSCSIVSLLSRAQEAETWALAQDTQRRPWRFYQGRDTQRVDAHTRKPAQAEAWYAEPADYESLVLYSEPFVTREEAEAWAKAHNK